MAKSPTRKKYAKKPTDEFSREVSKVATDYIKQWTNRQLGKIQRDEKYPVCVPTKDGYRIGLYRLTVFPNKTCDVYDQNHEFIHRFETKVSAILFTIYTIKRRYSSADEILLWDRVINKNYTDVLTLQRTIEYARKQKDFDLVDIRQSRLDIAQAQLQFARDKIAQLHRFAKLAKVWE